MLSYARRALAIAFVIVSTAYGPAALADGLSDKLSRIEALYSNAEGAAPVAKYRAYSEISEVFLTIIAEHPESEAATQILLGKPVGNVDVAAVRAVVNAGEPPQAAEAAPAAETGPAAEAEPAAEAAAAQAETDTSRPGTPFDACFRAPPGDDGTIVVLQVEIGADGALSAAPTRLEPEWLTTSARRLATAGTAAIEDCAPYPDLAGSRSVTVTVSHAGLTLEGGAEPSASPAAEPEAATSTASAEATTETTTAGSGTATTSDAPTADTPAEPATPAASALTATDDASAPADDTASSDSPEALAAMAPGTPTRSVTVGPDAAETTPSAPEPAMPAPAAGSSETEDTPERLAAMATGAPAPESAEAAADTAAEPATETGAATTEATAETTATGSDAEVASTDAATAAAPAEPAASDVTWVAADEATEEALALNRSTRREIQRRVKLLGFDPRGVDGVFGPGSRSAITAWQESRSIPATGFLDAAQIEALREESKDQYARWEAEARRIRRERERASPSGRYIDRRGCLRERNGRYVPNFKPGCG